VGIRFTVGRAAVGLIVAGAAFAVLGAPRASASPETAAGTPYSHEFRPGATSIAVATDSTLGPLIAFRNGDGFVWAKEGSLDSGWVQEQGPGVQSVAVASDGRNGPLIAILDHTGTVWAKEGSLDSGWVLEKGVGHKDRE
jgi:hypothetical protein